MTVWWRGALTIGLLSLVGCSSPNSRTADTLSPIGTAPVPSAADPLAQPTDPTVTTVAPPPSVSLPLAAGPVTVVAVGDSLTVGQGDSQRIGYPGRLKGRLDQVRPGSDVLNLAKSGWTSTEVIKGRGSDISQLDGAVEATRHAIDAKRPVVATVLIGSNDLWDLYDRGPVKGTGADDESKDVDNYRANITTIITSLQEAGAVVLIGLPDDQSQRPVATNRSLRRQSFPGISDDEVQRLSAQSIRYDAVVTEVATGLGATVVDFASTTIFTDTTTMSADGNHPNAAGYDAMTDVWWSAIEPLLG